jgi:hypothetical protein
MGAEHGHGIDSPMATMPDTCTEVTANYYNYPVDVEGSLSLPLTELHEYLFNKPFQKRTMQLPMWRQQHVAFRAYSKRVFYKRRTRCRHLILKIFRQKIQEKFNS